MAEPILVTGKRISDMELVTVVVGTEKIPTGQAGDLSITPDQIAQHVITKGDFATQEDLSQVEVNLQTQLANTNLELTNQTAQTRALLAAETSARLSGDSDLSDALNKLTEDLSKEVSDRIAEDALKVDIEGSVKSVSGRVGDVVLTPVDIGYPDLPILDLREKQAQFVVDSSGLTQEVINRHAAICLESVDDLRGFIASNLFTVAQTRSYYTGFGVGGSTYYWDNLSSDPDDGFSVIAVNGVSTGRWRIALERDMLEATQAGLIADLPSTQKLDQASIVQKCVDYMAKIGGGIVQLPTGHVYAKVVMKSNVELVGTISPYVTNETDVTMAASRGIVNEVKVTHGTFLHSTGSTDTIYIGENIDNTAVRNLELKPERSFDTGLCGFGIRLAGRNCVIENVKGEGFRFEPLYLRGKDDPNNRGGTCVNTKVLNCEFGNSARNSFAAVYCSDLYIKNTDFYQTDTGIAWVYLWDIEPNPSTTDTVYNVTVDTCTFNAISRSGAEPTVLVKEQNTPTGSPNVKFLNSKFKGAATIRNNCQNGWAGCVVDNCEFDGRAFSTTLGYTILSGRFTNNKLFGLSNTQFAFNNPFTGDFVIEGNTFNDTIFAGVNLTSPSFGLNYFTGAGTVVSPIDRRSITAQYRDRTLLELVNPVGGLSAFNTIEVRQLNLTTTPTQILTAKNRSTSVITIAAADSSVGGSLGLVELVITSDDTTSTTFATEKINGVAGVNFSWSGRTLSLSTKAAAANQWIIKVETFSNSSNQKQVTWL